MGVESVDGQETQGHRVGQWYPQPASRIACTQAPGWDACTRHVVLPALTRSYCLHSTVSPTASSTCFSGLELLPLGPVMPLKCGERV